MKVTIVHQGKEQRIEVAGGTSVAALLERVGINAETVIVRKNSEIVPDTEAVEDGDLVEALRIISGG